MGANILMLVLAFLNNKLIYVYLDQETNGVYFLVIRFAAFAALLLGDWLRLSNLNLAGGNRNFNRVLVANTLWYSVFLAGFLFLAFKASYPALPPTVFGLSRQYLLLALAAAAVIILKDSLQSIVLANQLLQRYAAAIAISSILFLGFDFLFLAVFGFGIYAVIIAWFISIAGAIAWSFFAMASFDGCSLRPSMTIFMKSRDIGWRAWIAIIGLFLMINIHIYSIEPIIGDPEKALVMVAMFSVCYRIFQLLQRFGDVSAYLLHSKVVRQETEESFRMTVRIVRSIILFSTAASLAIICFGKNIILIISSSEYFAVYIPFLIMVPGIIAVSAGGLINSFYWGQGYPLKITIAPFAAAALGLILDIVLLPQIGLAGVTLSFSIANICWMAYLSVMFSRDSGVSLGEMLIPRLSDIRFFVSKLKGLPA